MKGTVKWFDEHKGYGFIVGEDDTEYFVHFSGIISDQKFKKLHEGNQVIFDLQDNERGPIAINVKKGGE